MEIWEQVLGVSGFGVDADFFELGGHSVLLTQVAVRMQDLFGAEAPPVREFFERPTVAGLATLVVRSRVRAEEADTVASLLEEIRNLAPEEVQARLRAEAGPRGSTD